MDAQLTVRGVHHSGELMQVGPLRVPEAMLPPAVRDLLTQVVRVTVESRNGDVRVFERAEP